MSLRDYQIESIDRVRRLMQTGCRRRAACNAYRCGGRQNASRCGDRSVALSRMVDGHYGSLTERSLLTKRPRLYPISV